MKKLLGFLCFVLLGGFAFAQDVPEMILFYGETCPHCKAEEGYIAQLQDEYEFNLIGHEVYYNTDNQQLMGVYGRKFGTEFTGVPVVIMGDDYFVGESYDDTLRLVEKYAQKKAEIEQESEPQNQPTAGQEQDIKENIEIVPEIEITPIELTGDSEELTGTNENSGDILINDQKIEFLGKEIKLKEVGPIVFGIILGFVDGINPCMFGVLIFLLTYLVSVGSKKKVLYSGIIFVITTFILYYGIMYLMHNLIFSTMKLLPYIAYIKYAIGIIAIILGLIEVKDFFFYGKGISLKIPASIKPTLEYITKKGTYMSAFVLAVLSTFVELPCTIGIPLAYVGAVGDNINIFLALGIYNFFFIVPLLIIVFGIYFGLSAFKSDENGNMKINDLSSKKIMRIIAGIILIVLGILFLTKII